MITSATDMIRALKRDMFTGVILYEGPSALNGAPIAIVATRIVDASDNGKTGAMVQTFIIPADRGPLAALRSGQDEAVCGSCQHRPANEGTCYVNVGRSVEPVGGALSRRRYARPGVDYDPAILPDLFEGLVVRAGTYGDPAAGPYAIWKAALSKALAVTGYTHQWRDARFAEFKAFCMASSDSLADKEAANAAGWRTFRVRTKGAPVAKGEVICPASEEAGKKTTCDKCRACGGHSSRARADIVIEAHGATKARFK